MQGLKELNVEVITSVADNGDINKLKGAIEKLTDDVEKFGADMAATLAKPRDGKFDRKFYQMAIEAARLDVDGEGRLSDDKKPGIVSLTVPFLPDFCVFGDVGLNSDRH